MCRTVLTWIKACTSAWVLPDRIFLLPMPGPEQPSARFELDESLHFLPEAIRKWLKNNKQSRESAPRFEMPRKFYCGQLHMIMVLDGMHAVCESQASTIWSSSRVTIRTFAAAQMHTSQSTRPDLSYSVSIAGSGPECITSAGCAHASLYQITDLTNPTLASYRSAMPLIRWRPGLECNMLGSCKAIGPETLQSLCRSSWVQALLFTMAASAYA